MALGSISSRTSVALLCLLLLAALPPGAALAAPDGQPRNYIVTLDIAGANASIVPGGRAVRQRISRRAARVGGVTDRLAAQHGFRAGHRFERAVSGFSARLTPRQAARIAQDAKVASVRPARVFRPAGQTVPLGVQRVKAEPGAPAGPDVDVDVAVLDTGIGPVGGGELNVAGGVNCADDPGSAGYDPDDWQDSIFNRHGTHVAGTIGARDNGIGAVGVAPGARLWAVRVFDGSFGDESSIVCGLLWAISTHDGASAPPGSQPVEVINMSLQGPRGPIVEACPGAIGDAMHAAICAAVDAGITVVVAAGNSNADARNTVPAGYDQVITVGALSDFDGSGWGKATSACSGYEDEVDDAYAGYSNWGVDVDIVAPGTCVLSTTTGDGTATRRLTGTSMASPHVAGAVARYLAVHPGTAPAQMGRLVRAAGRMDWDPRTDRLWSGVNDADQPNRVLDVGSLLGSEDVRVWLVHDRFKVGGDETERVTRVDVQRGGGYAGTVNLAASGLPAAVGSATFEQPALSGLTGLGTRLRLGLDTGGPDGDYAVTVTATGVAGGPDGSRVLDLTVDRTGPVVTDLGVRPRAGRARLATSGAARVFVGWDAADALSDVGTSELRRRVWNRSWKLVGRTSGTSRQVTLQPRQRNRFRVVSADSLGNRTRTPAVEARLSIRDSSSGQWRQPAAGGWVRKRARRAYGGSLLVANKPAAALTTTFAGTAFALVAPVGPGRGVLRVRVDGGDWHEVSLKAIRGSQRRVVFSRRVADGVHTLEVEGPRGQTALDAVLIIR